MNCCLLCWELESVFDREGDLTFRAVYGRHRRMLECEVKQLKKEGILEGGYRYKSYTWPPSLQI